MCGNSYKGCNKVIRLKDIRILDITLLCDHIKFQNVEPCVYSYNEYGEAYYALCAACGADANTWCKYDNKVKGNVFMGKCL